MHLSDGLQVGRSIATTRSATDFHFCPVCGGQEHQDSDESSFRVLLEVARFDYIFQCVFERLRDKKIFCSHPGRVAHPLVIQQVKIFY